MSFFSKTPRCIEGSPTYKKIINHKNNRKILPNGDIRIGKDLAISSKNHILYQIKNDGEKR